MTLPPKPVGTIRVVKTVVVGPRPPELEAVIARRHALGQDTHDEVWEGDYHMAPAAHPWHGYLVAQLLDVLKPWAERAGLVRLDAFNLGDAGDYRVPDIGLLRSLPDRSFVPTAAFVVEVVSAGDESWEKFDFYAARGIDEVLIADPEDRELTLFGRVADGYERRHSSEVLGARLPELADGLHWPAS
jgi:Putative restriction endonuclease